MLQKIKRLSMQRWPWMLLILSCLGLLASALYFQYGLNLQPCIKCIYIRSAFVGFHWLRHGVEGALCNAKLVCLWMVRVVLKIGMAKEKVSTLRLGLLPKQSLFLSFLTENGQAQGRSRGNGHHATWWWTGSWQIMHFASIPRPQHHAGLWLPSRLAPATLTLMFLHVLNSGYINVL